MGSGIGKREIHTTYLGAVEGKHTDLFKARAVVQTWPTDESATV